MINKIIEKYEAYNNEELDNLSIIKKENKYPYLKDLAQVVDAKTFIKEGMILIRKHPRFCYVRKHKSKWCK